jgi:putative membrane protein
VHNKLSILESTKMNFRKSTFLSIGISGALVAGAIWFLFSHPYEGWAGGYWPMPHAMMFGGAAGFGIFMILFWVVVIVALGLLMAALFSNDTGHVTSSRSESAIEILRKRYARGEIDKERYDAMRRDLEEGEVK